MREIVYTVAQKVRTFGALCILKCGLFQHHKTVGNRLAQHRSVVRVPAAHRNHHVLSIVCRRTYVLPRILSFFRRLISELAERNSTTFGHMVWSQCSLKTHVRNLGYPLPLQIGGPKSPFWRTSQLNGNFNGLYLRNETRYRQLGKCVINHKGSPTSSKNVINFGPQTASNSTCIFTDPM